MSFFGSLRNRVSGAVSGAASAVGGLFGGSTAAPAGTTNSSAPTTAANVPVVAVPATAAPAPAPVNTAVAAAGESSVARARRIAKEREAAMIAERTRRNRNQAITNAAKAKTPAFLIREQDPEYIRERAAALAAGEQAYVAGFKNALAKKGTRRRRASTRRGKRAGRR